jgi:hypothetical protein
MNNTLVTAVCKPHVINGVYATFYLPVLLLYQSDIHQWQAKNQWHTLKVKHDPSFRDSARSQFCLIAAVDWIVRKPNNNAVSACIWFLSSPHTCEVCLVICPIYNINQCGHVDIPKELLTILTNEGVSWMVSVISWCHAQTWLGSRITP